MFNSYSDDDKARYMAQLVKANAKEVEQRAAATKEIEKYKKQSEEAARRMKEMEKEQEEAKALMEERAEKHGKTAQKELAEIQELVKAFVAQNPGHELLADMTHEEAMKHFTSLVVPKTNCAQDVRNAENNLRSMKMLTCASRAHYDHAKRKADGDNNSRPAKQLMTDDRHSTLQPPSNRVVLETPEGEELDLPPCLAPRDIYTGGHAFHTPAVPQRRLLQDFPKPMFQGDSMPTGFSNFGY
jgi:hypothetical protein